MMVAWHDDVFVRHAADESAVWSVDTEACVVLKNAKQFLDEIHRKGRTIIEIADAIVHKLHCSMAEVLDDFYLILNTLSAMGLVSCSASGCADSTSFVSNFDGVTEKCKTDASYLDFCLKHKMISDIHIDMTDRCNERCIHCYVPEGGVQHIETAIAFRILSEFRELGGMSAIFSGGECMLHPEFGAVLKKSRSLDLNIVILSNLTMCNENTVRLLREVRPQFISVSLYSMDEKEHDAITRITGSWKRTMASIMRLLDAGVRLRLATPILYENMHAISGLKAFATENGIRNVFDIDIIGRMDHDCANRLHALGENDLLRVVRLNKPELCNRHMGKKQCAPHARVCEIGDYSINVNAHGNYYPCDGFHGMILGNAHTDSLHDVWRGKKLEQLRAMRNKDFGECATCNNRPWCKVCAMRNFNETGNIYQHAPFRCKLAEVYRAIEEESERM